MLRAQNCVSIIPMMACAAHLSQAALPKDKDPSVEWVFEVPNEQFLSFGILPDLTQGWISGGAVTDKEVILICNLGGATEALTHSRAYVLDLETGRVLKKIKGPTRTDWHPWAITRERVYFRSHERDVYWVALDLVKRATDWNPPFLFGDDDVLAREERVPGTNRVDRVGIDQGKLSGGEFVSGKLQRFRWDFGQGLVLTIERDSKPGGFESFELASTDARGGKHTRRLCRLPVRRGGTGKQLLKNDDRHLLFAWCGTLICVDKRRLLQAGKGEMDSHMLVKPRAASSPSSRPP